MSAIYDIYGNKISTSGSTVVQSTDVISTEAVSTALKKTNALQPPYWILHLDCGRKYFSVANIKLLIDNIATAGFNQLQLHFSENQGFRFALDDMKVITDSGADYDLTPCLGDSAYNIAGTTDGSGKWLTETEMDEIIAYARTKSIDVVPSFDMPGHMNCILKEFPDFISSQSDTMINILNDEAVEFALAIADKYSRYFASRGCTFYNIGADEAPFVKLNNSGLMSYFAEFVNRITQVIIRNGLIPRAFNDGILYADNYSAYINKSIQVLYWSGYYDNYATAKTLHERGHQLINSSSDYYWILGGQHASGSAINFSAFSYNDEQLDNHSGAQCCIWCDNGAYDGLDDGAGVVENTATLIANFGKAISKYTV